jgi:hypothetical protein
MENKIEEITQQQIDQHNGIAIKWIQDNMAYFQPIGLLLGAGITELPAVPIKERIEKADPDIVFNVLVTNQCDHVGELLTNENVERVMSEHTFNTNRCRFLGREGLKRTIVSLCFDIMEPIRDFMDGLIGTVNLICFDGSVIKFVPNFFSENNKTVILKYLELLQENGNFIFGCKVVIPPILNILAETYYDPNSEQYYYQKNNVPKNVFLDELKKNINFNACGMNFLKYSPKVQFEIFEAGTVHKSKEGPRFYNFDKLYWSLEEIVECYENLIKIICDHCTIAYYPKLPPDFMFLKNIYTTVMDFYPYGLFIVTKQSSQSNDSVSTKINDNVGAKINDNVGAKINDNVGAKINDNVGGNMLHKYTHYKQKYLLLCH